MSLSNFMIPTPSLAGSYKASVKDKIDYFNNLDSISKFQYMRLKPHRSISLDTPCEIEHSRNVQADNKTCNCKFASDEVDFSCNLTDQQKEMFEYLCASSCCLEIVDPVKPVEIIEIENPVEHVEFTAKISDIAELTDEGVPIVVEKCINFINSCGLLSEGIYRINGNVNNVNKLTQLFKTSAREMELKPKEHDEYDVASAFKKFIRDELPLIGTKSTDFRNVLKTPNLSDRLEMYQCLLYQLDHFQYETLRKIIEHLQKLANNDLNKMTVDSLASIWSNNLFPFNMNVEEFFQNNVVVVDFILHFDKLFDMRAPYCQNEQLLKDTYMVSLQGKGELKFWIKVFGTQKQQSMTDGYVVATLTHTKTVYDISKELANQLQTTAENITLSEVLLNDDLKRPMPPQEVIAKTIMRWINFSKSDRQNIRFVVYPKEFFRNPELVSAPSTRFDINYADGIEMKQPTAVTAIVSDQGIVLHYKSNGTSGRDIKIDTTVSYAYLGAMKNWGYNQPHSITLIETGQKTRALNDPLRIHLLACQSQESQVSLYLAIIQNCYRNKF